MKTAPADLLSGLATLTVPDAPLGEGGEMLDKSGVFRGFEQELAALITAPATAPSGSPEEPRVQERALSEGKPLPEQGKALPTATTRVSLAFEAQSFAPTPSASGAVPLVEATNTNRAMPAQIETPIATSQGLVVPSVSQAKPSLPVTASAASLEATPVLPAGQPVAAPEVAKPSTTVSDPAPQLFVKTVRVTAPPPPSDLPEARTLEAPQRRESPQATEVPARIAAPNASSPGAQTQLPQSPVVQSPLAQVQLPPTTSQTAAVAPSTEPIDAADPEPARRRDLDRPVVQNTREATPQRLALAEAVALPTAATPLVPDAPRLKTAESTRTLELPTRAAVAQAPQAEAEAESEAGVDASEPARKAAEHASPLQRSAPSTATAPLAQAAPAPAPAAEQSAQTSQAPVLSAAQPTTAPAQPITEVRADPRIAPQIETAIEQLAETKQATRTARPEILMRHGDFGLVSMRLDASSGDLRATLAARDPGFVPAVQAALAERTVAASSDTANTSGQRGQEQTAQSGANSNNSGQTPGGGFAQNYGSSPGSSQAPPSPRMHHQDEATRDHDESAGDRAAGTPDSASGAGGVFA